MKEQIRLLVELQKTDSSIIRQKRIKASIPQKALSAEQPLRDAQASYDRQKLKYDAAEKKKKEKERLLEDTNDRIRKQKARSAEIKTNKEYQAHQKEIESAERERIAIEDEILVLMESVDAALTGLKAEEEKIKAEKEKYEEFKKRLDEDAGIAEKDMAGQMDKRTAAVKEIDRELYNLYFKILTAKGDSAIVEAKDEICQGCHMNMPPQLFVEIKKCEKVIQCPQCNRILYWAAEDAPVNDPV